MRIINTWLSAELQFVDQMVVNSWSLFRRDCFDLKIRSKDISALYVFKAALAKSLVMVYISKRRGRPSLEDEMSPKRRPGPRKSVPCHDVRCDGDGVNHWPIVMKSNRCKNLECNGKPLTGCHKCNANRCITKRNCFAEFPDARL